MGVTLRVIPTRVGRLSAPARSPAERLSLRSRVHLHADKGPVDNLLCLFAGVQIATGRCTALANPIAPLDLSWLLVESPSGTTHVGAMLLFKKPPGRRNTVREVVEAYRRQQPQPPFNFVPELIGTSAPHFREVDDWDPYYHVQHLSFARRKFL